MAGPVFDTRLIATQLASLVTSGLVLEVVDIAGRATADRARRLTQRPGVLIVPISSEAVWRDGNGGDTKVTERIGVHVELADLAQVERAERPGLTDIREAIHLLLEGCQLDANWSELRYEGGEIQDMTDASIIWRDIYTTWTGTSKARWQPT